MPLRRILRSLRIRPLAGRLLAYVLLFSLVLSLAATGAQILGEYHQQKAALSQSQKKAAEVIVPSLAANVWAMSWPEVRTEMHGLLRMPGISYARISTPEGISISVGTPPTEQRIQQRFPLIYHRPAGGRSEMVGELLLTTSTASLYQHLRHRALLTLLFQSIIVLLGSLGLLLIVRLILTRHLETMADYASRLNLDALIAPLRLRRRQPRHGDELSELERALNTMRVKLLEDAQRLRESELQSQNERDIAVRANRAKNLFLANVSHELRTPLQAVMGYATLLSDTQLDPEQRDYVATLQHSAENLSSIINDLLDVSRMEAGKLELEEIPFDIRDTLNDVMVMLGSRAREKGLALEMRVDDDLPKALVGDPVRLRQMLVNLVSNAIKFTESGHVMISAEALRRENSNILLRLSVEDTGIGISDEELPLIYEPYVQFGPHARKPISGAGLGLTITHQLVNLMHGQLDVRSTPGEGSTFWVDLTLPVASTQTARVRIDTSAIRGKHFLVADSYALSRKITLELLARLDVELDSARSAAEALQWLTQSTENGHSYDAVILDGFLPDMDADQCCRQIRQNHTWGDPRILVLSSNPQRGDAEHFRQAGADAFLSKSVRESVLVPMLQRLLTDRDHNERHFLTRFSLEPARGRKATTPLPCAPMHVLVVEDNPVNRQLTQRLLEKLGCRVTVAVDGGEVLKLVQAHQFQVIFMDCVLPQVDGFEATRRLRRWEADTMQPRTTVVALTASATERDEERCLRAGMDAFIAKPVRIDILRSVLERYCETTVGM